jgi:hypothetical protein
MANLGTGLGGAVSGAASGAAVGGPLGAGIGGVAGLLGGLFSGGSNDSDAILQKALDQYNGISSPDLSSPLALQQYLQGGTLSPELLQKLNLNADQATTLTENPANRANQQGALNALKSLSQTGMSAQDLAQMSQMRSQVAGDTQAKIQALLQGQQMRGQASGGDTLAAQLSSIQAGNQQASKDAQQQAAAAEQARQQALMSYANLSGQIRGQDTDTQKFNTQNDIERQRFLDQNSLSRQTGNVGAKNNANLYNLQRQQSVGDTNTGTYNQELARQAQAKQQEYQNAVQLANSKANVMTGQAQNSATNATNSAQSFGNILNGAGQVASGIASNNRWNSLMDKFGNKTT